MRVMSTSASQAHASVLAFKTAFSWSTTIGVFAATAGQVNTVKSNSCIVTQDRVRTGENVLRSKTARDATV